MNLFMKEHLLFFFRRETIMHRVFNFSSGPSALPLPVLEKAQKELCNYQQTGMSVMEMSHRSSAYQDIMDETSSLLRELMEIPDNYQILFLPGGASLQFSMVPLNLLRKSKKADYIHTGSWSKKAIAEAKKYGEIRIAASSEEQQFREVPALNKIVFDDEADYVHITVNNTIEGTCFHQIPHTGNVPLVADMSSNILSTYCDVSAFGIIYAGAQKNLGTAGVTIVLVREDLIGNATSDCPTMLDYQTHSKHHSLYNTPPSYSIYITKLVLEWLKEMGGVSAIESLNREKARLLYTFLDESKLFTSNVERNSRSLMNIPFTTDSDNLNQKFIEEAKAAGLVTLGGHRSVGGMRASIYNAMPLKGVQELVAFMSNFEMNNR